MLMRCCYTSIYIFKTKANITPAQSIILVLDLRNAFCELTCVEGGNVFIPRMWFHAVPKHIVFIQNYYNIRSFKLGIN